VELVELVELGGRLPRREALHRGQLVLYPLVAVAAGERHRELRLGSQGALARLVKSV